MQEGDAGADGLGQSRLAEQSADGRKVPLIGRRFLALTAEPFPFER